MSRIITFSVSASDPESDAPTVSDFLDQVRDYFDLMISVEQTLAENGESAIDWRIVDARKNSPLSLQVKAFPKQFAVNIDKRADLILDFTVRGLKHLAAGATRPQYFNDHALTKATKIFERVTNGLDLTRLDVADMDFVVITPSIARTSVKNAREIIEPKGKPYRELGSVEGHLKTAERDGFGRSVLFIKHRMTGNEIKCILSSAAQREVGLHEIDEVWKNRRLEVYGAIHYSGPGKITRVEASRVRFLRSRSELPDAAAIIDPDFTGGLTSEEFLSRLHDGQ